MQPQAKAPRCWNRQEGSSPAELGGSSALPHSCGLRASGLQDWKETDFCCSKPPDHGHLLQQPRETNPPNLPLTHLLDARLEWGTGRRQERRTQGSLPEGVFVPFCPLNRLLLGTQPKTNRGTAHVPARLGEVQPTAWTVRTFDRLEAAGLSFTTHTHVEAALKINHLRQTAPPPPSL